MVQIEEGADCDVFISAGQEQMDQLDITADAAVNTDGLDFVEDGSRIDLLENKVTLVVPKENETGIESFDDLKKAASVLLAKGVHRVFISLGRHGVFYADAEGVQRYRCAHPMDQIANATGAGDSFLGALLYSHVRGLSLEETLQAAMAVSMLTIQSDATINPLMSEELLMENIALAEEDTEVDISALHF